MSHAPVNRKSSKALDAAAANAASRRPAPHQVVLRVKRKRGDAAVESLLVAPTADEASGDTEEFMPNRKRRAGLDALEDTLAVLTLEKAAKNKQQHLRDHQHSTAVQAPEAARLCYKRARGSEPDETDDQQMRSPTGVQHARVTQGMKSDNASRSGGRLDALLMKNGANDHSTSQPSTPIVDYLEVRRVKAKGVNVGVTGGTNGSPGSGKDERRASATSIGTTPGATDLHVIDLQPFKWGDGAADTTGLKRDEENLSESGVTPATRRAAPILNPSERQMDEAIFVAFKTGDPSGLRATLASSPSLVNYRRKLGDGTTALMAAAFHGDTDAVRYLLSLGAKASLVDATGRSAAVYAGMGAHHKCFAELQRIADEEARAARLLGEDRDDFVYDLYYFEPPASRSSMERGGAGLPDVQAGGTASMIPTVSGPTTKKTATGAPVVRLAGIGPVDENATATAGMELIFEHDSDWSELGDKEAGEDTDSNSEGFYGNDYPEDDGDDDGAPYLYGGSSGASEDGSSSDGGFLSDDHAAFNRVGVPLDFESARGALGSRMSAQSNNLNPVGPASETQYTHQTTVLGGGGTVGLDDVISCADPGRSNLFAWDSSRVGASESRDGSSEGDGSDW